MQMPTIRSLTILSQSSEARVPGQWRPWRPDIVIAYRGLVCVVEVDGHHHDKRHSADVSRDRVLMKSGFAFVEQVCVEDVETDEDDADLVVDWVIERLERLASWTRRCVVRVRLLREGEPFGLQTKAHTGQSAPLASQSQTRRLVAVHRPVSDPGSEAWRRTSTERPRHQRARIRTIGETCNQPRKSTVNQCLWPVGRSVAYCKVDEMDLDFPPAMKRESRVRDARRLGQTGQVGSSSRRAVTRTWHQAAVTN